MLKTVAQEARTTAEGCEAILVTEPCYGKGRVKVDTLRGEMAKRRAEGNPFAEDVIMRIVFDIASALKFLHGQQCPIICRNLEVILV